MCIGKSNEFSSEPPTTDDDEQEHDYIDHQVILDSGLPEQEDQENRDDANGIVFVVLFVLWWQCLTNFCLFLCRRKSRTI